MEEEKRDTTTPPETSEETTEQIRLTGIIIKDLLNPKFLEELEKEKLNFTPFLVGIDINTENIIIINHHDQKETEAKVLHIESRLFPGKNKSYLENVMNALKKIKTD